ncbi:phosphatase [Paenibacillus sp. CCS19]|uniref:HAD family hydrolase n=1 Tax=Paenibacillus sp. CCS19 TaxID=3158387 RepID=UPI0025696678|nr:HAD family phosphatase [Paenibacillus cellulosilyticus]GMK39584.1 phosphatase [Paenibacillus cellulosilyticus]
MEAVIFDMDGVLIDSHSISSQMLCETANGFGCNLTIDEIKAWGSLSSRQFWANVKNAYDLSQSLEELIQSYNVDREIEKYKEIGLMPGVKNLLKDIKAEGIKTAIATSASRKRMNAVVTIFELSDYFDQYVCDDEVKMSKPDPGIYLLAAKKLGINPSSCVVIEDSNNGLRSAKFAGMKCIGFKGLPHVNENLDGADKLITEFIQLTVKDIETLCR